MTLDALRSQVLGCFDEPDFVDKVTLGKIMLLVCQHGQNEYFRGRESTECDPNVELQMSVWDSMFTKIEGVEYGS